MHKLVRFAPAKINLFLAITGRRPDGFHELVSVVAPVAWGDRLTLGRADATALACGDPAVPTDERNLVLRALGLFRELTGWDGHVTFALDKAIPMGAGLGGGSSDGVAALLGLNELAGHPLGEGQLAELAGRLGSDCPLFLAAGPVVMRGRGEVVAPLPEAAAARLRGQRVLVFKPGFGVPTAWAYQELARTPDGSYLPAPVAEARLRAWLDDPTQPVESLLLNTMERAVFPKFLALPEMLRRLRDEFGVAARMSGSGSACFAVLPETAPGPEMAAVIRECWGPSSFVRETRFA